ncbi:MAG: hypothetical protein J0I30_02450, partial [Burkholderiales bacterium]|nr:hypothetical protein [Burkholderiales bacterium]
FFMPRNNGEINMCADVFQRPLKKAPALRLRLAAPPPQGGGSWGGPAAKKAAVFAGSGTP